MAKTIYRDSYRALIGLLRARREELGMTQAAAAALVGWSQQTYSGVETCTRRVDVIEYFWIARKLGMDVDRVFRAVSDAIQALDNCA